MAELIKEQIEEFKQEEKESGGFSDCMNLAEKVAEAGDKVWAQKLYKRAEELAEDFYEYRNLVNSVVNEIYLGDKEYARDLSKKAESLASRSTHFLDLAESYASDDRLGDKVYAMELYKKSEELATSGLDYCYLAHSVAEESYINDKNYAIKLLEKAESDPGGSHPPRVLRDVGGIYCHQINDKSKAREVFEKCEKLIDTWEPAGILRPYWNEKKGQQFIYLAHEVSDENGLDDKEFARELYKKAEYYISSRGFDASELAGYLEDFDEEWSKNVKNGNYGTQGTLDETNDTKSEGL